MKFLHLSDLHLGKRLNEYSLQADQEHIIYQILEIADQEQPNAVLVAGDVYDKPAPGTEALGLMMEFLNGLYDRHIPVLLISGNHDSPERLSFGGRFMEGSGIHIAPAYSGHIAPVTLSDEYGEVDFYMLPFIKPIHVRRFFPELDILTYTDALQAVVDEMNVDTARRSVLMAHQFVTGDGVTEKAGSEELTVGGLDNVDAAVLAPFDYVALGHIHKAQNIASSRIRYCGTPLKYSAAEAEQQKSITVVEMEEKGRVAVREVPLKPIRDLVCRRGSFTELYASGCQDYVRLILTDEEEKMDAAARLRTVYPYFLSVEYDNGHSRYQAQLDEGIRIENKTEEELFSEFYQLIMGEGMSEDQTQYMKALIEELREGENS